MSGAIHSCALVLCDAANHHISRLASELTPLPRAVELAAALFRALGDNARLRLMTRLIDRELCVGELAAAEGESMPAISQRLRILRAENIVVRRRDGKHIRYALADQHITQMVLNALAHVDEPADRS